MVAQPVEAQGKTPPTMGTRLFNIATYGGVGTIGNELASGIITNSAKTEGGKLHGAFKRTEVYFNRLKAKHEWLPAYTNEQFPTILFALIGGMLMVPPIKWLEDNKASIVRKMDNWIKGPQANNDPNTIAAHEELDRAPKQSWSSLGVARMITVASAVTADFTFGWSKSVSARLLKGTKAEKFSSLEHIAEQTAKLIYPKEISEKGVKSDLFKKAENYTWLLTLSASLSILFYASSKLMAGKEEKTRVRRQEKRAARANGMGFEGDAMEADQATAQDVTEKPQTQISGVEAHEKLSAKSELQLA